MNVRLRLLAHMCVFIAADRVIDALLELQGDRPSLSGILLRVLPALAFTVAVALAMPPGPWSSCHSPTVSFVWVIGSA